MKIDLTAYTRQYLEVTLPTGETVNLPLPTQGTMINMMSYQQRVESCTPVESMREACALLDQILSTNREGIKLADEYTTKNLDFVMMQALLTAYMEFVTETQSAKNLKSPTPPRQWGDRIAKG